MARHLVVDGGHVADQLVLDVGVALEPVEVADDGGGDVGERGLGPRHEPAWG